MHLKPRYLSSDYFVKTQNSLYHQRTIGLINTKSEITKLNKLYFISTENCIFGFSCRKNKSNLKIYEKYRREKIIDAKARLSAI